MKQCSSPLERWVGRWVGSPMSWPDCSHVQHAKQNPSPPCPSYSPKPPIHCWSHTILSMRLESFVVISFLSPNLKKSSLLSRSQIHLLLCILSLSKLKSLSSVSNLLSPTLTFLPNAHPTHSWQASSQNTDQQLPSPSTAPHSIPVSWVNKPAA